MESVNEMQLCHGARTVPEGWRTAGPLVQVLPALGIPRRETRLFPMPRLVSSSIEWIPGLSSKALFSVLYGNSAFLAEYQATVNTCPNPSIDDFAREPGTGSVYSRVVEFSLPINAPGVIMRLIGGSERIAVRERQSVSVLGDGTIVLTSQPRPQIGRLGEGFTSDAEVRICDAVRDGVGGCRVVGRVEVAANGAPYGTVQLVEKFMGDTALSSLEGLLSLMEAHVGRLKDEGVLDDVVLGNLERAPALHAFLGFDLAAGADVFTTRGGDDDGGDDDGGAAVVASYADDGSMTMYYDDRNDDILHAIDDVRGDIERLSERMEGIRMMLDDLVANRNAKDVSKDVSKDVPLRVSMRVEVMPLLVTTSLVAAATIALFSSRCRWVMTS